MPERSILLVEDDAQIVTIFQEIIDKFFSVPLLSANSAAEAKLMWRDHAGEIKLIIVDLTLPDTSGKRLIAEFVRDNPAMPILAMTGSLVTEHEISLAVGKHMKNTDPSIESTIPYSLEIEGQTMTLTKGRKNALSPANA